MLATISVRTLLDSIARVGWVIEKKSRIPILTHINLSADIDGAFTVTATDCDIVATDSQNASVEAPGSFCVGYVALLDAVKGMPIDRFVTLSHDGSILTLSAASNRSALPTLASEDYPTLRRGDVLGEYSLLAHDFSDALNRVAFAMSDEETRYYLIGVSLKYVAGTWRFEATQGHMLARVTLPLLAPFAWHDVILPAKTIKTLMKNLGAKHLAQKHVRVRQIASGSEWPLVQFDYGSTRVTGKSIAGTFPDTDRIMPVGVYGSINVSAKGLISAAQSAAKATKTGAVKLAPNGTKMMLSVAEDGAVFETEIPADISCALEPIGFNPRYLAAVAGAMRADRVIIELPSNDARSPVLVRSPDFDRAVYVVMPMHL